ncbi:MAG: hypothetical protein CME64_08950 [Halobacteriovoraceae bacterium]|nr:hypothetical protein [Halobacteriovoraceae bacterium]
MKIEVVMKKVFMISCLYFIFSIVFYALNLTSFTGTLFFSITIGLWITLFVLPLTLKYAELHNLKTFNIMKFILRTAYIVCVAGVVLYISHYFKVTFYGSWKDFLFLVTAFLCFYGLLDYGSNSKNEAIS